MLRGLVADGDSPVLLTLRMRGQTASGSRDDRAPGAMGSDTSGCRARPGGRSSGVGTRRSRRVAQLSICRALRSGVVPVDRAQRQFEAWLPKLEEDAGRAQVAEVRQRYDEVMAKLAGDSRRPCNERDGLSTGSYSRPRFTTASSGRCRAESRISSLTRCATRWARNSRNALRLMVR